MSEFNVTILASGSGTNAEEIMHYFLGHEHIQVVGLFSNKPDAYALIRAEKFKIPTKVFSKAQWQDGTVLSWLKENRTTHIVLAGFLWLVPQHVIEAFDNRIINIHPALLPKFGGKGMYGGKVHEAVKAAGEKETGISIHLVNEKYDEGEMLFQAKCSVEINDTAEDIAKKIHQLEYAHYPKVIEQWILGERVSG
ncbi:MAG TPA: phosphoribosylglycinamide formyltransferase [Cyclobacteriaceae bacterium]|nr:phosphoribosylglycinamide formyltransferase [Cyclobacteriaceae bacterium]